MNPARVFIVEDKAVIAENLHAVLTKAGYIVCGKATSGEEALELIRAEAPDVILMDIQLAGKLDGIQTVEQIQLEQSIPVIYLTDFQDKETTARAKHTRPANYLVKPFKASELLIAIDIAFYNASEGKEAQPGKNEKTEDIFFAFTDRFFIREKDVMYRVDLSDLLWIEADGSYCKIKTQHKNFTLSISLKVFSEKFSHQLLMRAHRSFVVNIDKIMAVKGNMLLIGDAEIPTSETYREELLKRLQMI